MKRLRHLVRRLGLWRGLSLRWSELRRHVAPCWGGPFDGSWQYSTTMALLHYVNLYPTVEGQPPIYSTSAVRMSRSVGLYVYLPSRGQYVWTALIPQWSDIDVE